MMQMFEDQSFLRSLNVVPSGRETGCGRSRQRQKISALEATLLAVRSLRGMRASCKEAARLPRSSCLQAPGCAILTAEHPEDIILWRALIYVHTASNHSFSGLRCTELYPTPKRRPRCCQISLASVVDYPKRASKGECGWGRARSNTKVWRPHTLASVFGQTTAAAAVERAPQGKRRAHLVLILCSDVIGVLHEGRGLEGSRWAGVALWSVDHDCSCVASHASRPRATGCPCLAPIPPGAPANCAIRYERAIVLNVSAVEGDFCEHALTPGHRAPKCPPKRLNKKFTRTLRTRTTLG